MARKRKLPDPAAEVYLSYLQAAPRKRKLIRLVLLREADAAELYGAVKALDVEQAVAFQKIMREDEHAPTAVVIRMLRDAIDKMIADYSSEKALNRGVGAAFDAVAAAKLPGHRQSAMNAEREADLVRRRAAGQSWRAIAVDYWEKDNPGQKVEEGEIFAMKDRLKKAYKLARKRAAARGKPPRP